VLANVLGIFRWIERHIHGLIVATIRHTVNDVDGIQWMMTLPTPTIDLVQEECAEFDKEPFTELAEEALAQLLTQFRRNTKVSHVLLKVIALDRLYSTRIQYVDLVPLAHHITDLNIDEAIEQGSPNAVDLIWNCAEIRKYYSFATKFCSWHNPDSYPMHDHYVDECLWAYKNQYPFYAFHREDMYDYEKFRPIVSAFREHYKLTSCSFKELDKFLWRMGNRMLREPTEAL
jgi:hypothetical protein